MSQFDSEGVETRGYFLSEDAQLRLKQLRGYVRFLASLARSRMADERQAWTAEIRPEDVATCLEWLAEQMGQVLDQLSWLAERGGGKAVASGAGASPETVVSDEAGARYTFGVTLDQVDAIHQLIDMIRAHGDVVMATHDAEFAVNTLPVLGHAIFGDAMALYDIIRQMESQSLGQAHGPQTGVGEARAVYRAGRAHVPGDSALPGTDWVVGCLDGGGECGRYLLAPERGVGQAREIAFGYH